MQTIPVLDNEKDKDELDELLEIIDDPDPDSSDLLGDTDASLPAIPNTPAV